MRPGRQLPNSVRRAPRAIHFGPQERQPRRYHGRRRAGQHPQPPGAGSDPGCAGGIDHGGAGPAVAHQRVGRRRQRAKRAAAAVEAAQALLVHGQQVAVGVSGQGVAVVGAQPLPGRELLKFAPVIAPQPVAVGAHPDAAGGVFGQGQHVERARPEAEMAKPALLPHTQPGAGAGQPHPAPAVGQQGGQGVVEQTVGGGVVDGAAGRGQPKRPLQRRADPPAAISGAGHGRHLGAGRQPGLFGGAELGWRAGPAGRQRAWRWSGRLLTQVRCQTYVRVC